MLCDNHGCPSGPKKTLSCNQWIRMILYNRPMQKEFIVVKLFNWLSLRGLYSVTRGTVTKGDFQSAIDDKDFYMSHQWSDTLHATWCQSSHSTRLTDLELDTQTKSGRTDWSHENIGKWWWWPVPKLHGGSFSISILIFWHRVSLKITGVSWRMALTQSIRSTLHYLLWCELAPAEVCSNCSFYCFFCRLSCFLSYSSSPYNKCLEMWCCSMQRRE